MESTKDDNNISQISLLKALADEVRLRLIRLLYKEELSVQELEYILQIPQPSVSRNLGVLKQNGLVNDRRDGQRAFYVLNPTKNNQQLELFDKYINQVVQSDHPDLIRLKECIDKRYQTSSQALSEGLRFGWDKVSPYLYNQTAMLMTLAELSGNNRSVADLGTGPGTFLPFLSTMSDRVFAIDSSSEMLNLARQSCLAQDITNVSFMQIPIEELALRGKITQNDRLLLHFVLNQIASPQSIISHLAQFLAEDNPDARLVITDSISDSEDEEATLRKKNFGTIWGGFSDEQMDTWANHAELSLLRWHRMGRVGKAPECFVAVLGRSNRNSCLKNN